MLQTGGTAVILGATGKNFGAGMSGGVAYVYDKDDRLNRLVNEDVAGDLFRIESTEVGWLWLDNAKKRRCNHCHRFRPGVLQLEYQYFVRNLNRCWQLCASVRLRTACLCPANMRTC